MKPVLILAAIIVILISGCVEPPQPTATPIASPEPTATPKVTPTTTQLPTPTPVQQQKPSALEFNPARKIEVGKGIYPGIIFANNHFYVSYEFGENPPDYRVFVKVYDKDFIPTGESHQLVDVKMSDHQMVFVDGYFYLVYGGGMGGYSLYLKKFDSDWNEIKKIAVAEQSPKLLGEEMEGDMLLYYADGSLYLGTPVAEIVNNGLHIREFNTNLEFQSDYHLNDVGHGFGSNMLLQDGTFIVASSRMFEQGVQSLIILRYNENWALIDEKRISAPKAGELSIEHYPTGFLFENRRYFVSYTDTIGESEEMTDMGDIILKVFDSDWNLLSQTKVTGDIRPNTANRAHLALSGNRAYVAYDVAGHGGSNIVVKEYTIISGGGWRGTTAQSTDK